jgi:hypothetical protein
MSLKTIKAPVLSDEGFLSLTPLFFLTIDNVSVMADFDGVSC